MSHPPVNDENLYNLRRAKHLPPHVASDSAVELLSDPVALATIDIPSQRVYLGNISNQVPSAVAPDSQLSSSSSSSSTHPILKKSRQSELDNDPSLPRRKPLGGDRAPLQQHQQQKSLLKSTEPISVPARLPQKRQASDSLLSTRDKIHTRQESVASVTTTSSSSSAGYKKSRLVDYEWQDLDEEDMDDPLMVSEYVSEIFTYMYELELRMLPDPQYLLKQKHLKPKMRSILVDWLVEMHLRFRLLPESLFLALNIMDRFMSIEVVQIDKLQLLATGSLFIAAKYEEVFSPSVKNYAYFTEGSYTEDEILQAEKYILTVLSFDLNYPNPMNFLRRISKADDYDVQLRTLGKYLLEITAVDYNFIGMRPSLCCAAAMYIARLILEKTPVWNGNLIHYSGGYRVSDLQQCAELLLQYLISPVEHDEFFKKYATRKFMKASILCRSWAKKFVALGKNLVDPSLSTHGISFTDNDHAS